MERVKKRGGQPVTAPTTATAGFITKPIPNSCAGRGQRPCFDRTDTDQLHPLRHSKRRGHMQTYERIQDAPTRVDSVLKPLHCPRTFLATSDPKVIDELRRISAVTAVQPLSRSCTPQLSCLFSDSPRSLTPSLPPSSSHHSASAWSQWCSLHPSSCGCSCACSG